jgi:hypothetical protein
MANVDPRHNGEFAAAFALGYAARVIEAGLDCLTLSALTGPFGLIAGAGEPTAEGNLRPLHRIVQTLASLYGSTSIQCASDQPGKILALAATEPDGGRLLWIANITAHMQTVDIAAWNALWGAPSPNASNRVALPPFGTHWVEWAG